MSQESKSLVFVIDDEVTLADSLAMVFSIKGYRVKIFETVQDALDCYQQGRIPEVIIMDYNLRGINGTEGIHAFKKFGYPGKFLGISADDIEEEMLEAGANSFWGKPLDMAGFVDAFDRLTEPEASVGLP